MFRNVLDGTLPAELGKLTDLESLCAALAAQPLADRSVPRLRVAVVRRQGQENQFSGTIGSWIGSMAKLTLL